MSQDKRILIANIWAGVLIMLIFGYTAFAQEAPRDPLADINASLNEIGSTIDLPTASPRETTLRIIQWALGLLGLVGVVMVIYGGLTWMTAAGNEERMGRAKKILTYATIGLIIILLSWAMVSFVIGRVSEFSQ